MLAAKWIVIITVLTLVVVGVAAGLIYQFVLNDSDASSAANTSSKVIIASTMLISSENRLRKVGASALRDTIKQIEQSCTIPTTSQLQTLCDLQLEEGADLSKLRLCEHGESNVRFEDGEVKDDDGNPIYYSFHRECRGSGHNPTFYELYQRRGANDIIVPLDNVSGEMYGMYLCLSGTDLFAAGFDPGANRESDFTDAFSSMVDGLPSSSISIVGNARPGSDIDATSTKYKFNAQNPVEWGLNTIAANTTLPTSVTPQGPGVTTHGVLRMITRHVDYTFTLSGSPQTVRLMITDPVVPMATKMVKDAGGTFKFVDVNDADNPTLVTNYEDAVKPLNFWTQPHPANQGGDESKDSEEIAEEAAHVAMSEAYIAAFKSTMLGMPVELQNETLDLSALPTSKQVTVDLIPNSTIAFGSAKRTDGFGGKSWTAEELVTNRAMMALLFQIDNIAFRAKLTISTG